MATTLEQGSRRFGWDDRLAYLVDDERCSHGQLHRAAARAASVLAAQGVTGGKRVLLASADGIPWVTAVLAVARLGAVASLVNPRLTAEDLKLIARDSEAVMMIADAEAPTVPGVPRYDIATLMTHDGDVAPAPAARVGDDAPLYLQYTSGTTGSPKGVEHRHGDLRHFHRAVGHDMLAIGPDDVSLSVSKLFFAYGFGNSFVYPLFTGSSAVLIEGAPTPGLVAELVARHGVTVLHAVPSAYANLVAETDPASFRSLRVAVSAGESLAPALGEGAEDLLGCPVLDELGSTEVGGAFCASLPADNRLGTVGRPLTGYSVEVRDGDGRRCPDGDQGQLWVQGPTVMTRYVNRPEETRRVLVDGWLRTGDLARRNVDGRIVHAGRIDDLEMVGGITISPVEVEGVLAAHPLVAEVAVTALPDDRGATKLQAFVVPAEDGHKGALGRDVLAWARRRLPPFKVPRRVHAVEELPRTPTGKLRRFVLRQRYGRQARERD